MSVQAESTTQQEVSHEATLFAEPIAHAGPFVITNALVMSWVTVLVLIIGSVVISRKIRHVPRGLQNIFEILLEQAFGLADTITGSRTKSERFLPIVLSLFLFILINNWLGLLPGVGTVGFVETEGAHSVFVPILRGGTADINTTLAISLFAVIASHVFGVVTLGIWKHMNKFINFHAFLEIPKKIKKDPVIVLVNPIKAFVGVIEMIGELAKVASLSLRLFGNIFAGEVLLASMMAIFAFILPLPFMFMEIIVGMVQALVFAILTLAFFGIATSAEEH